MLLGAIFDDPAKVVAFAIGIGAVVLWAILNPNSGAAQDYRAGEAAGRALREKHPILSAVLVVVLTAVIAGILIYRAS